MELRHRVALIAIATLTFAAPAAAQLPTDPAEAMAVFEGDVGKWADGPVRHLMLPDELEEWRSLDTDDERREFIAWFWDRRDEDLRDRRNPFKEDFYTRVAYANQRFRGFPRGWRSDRGQVLIVLGRPDGMRTDMGTELEIWTYYTYGGILRASSVMGEMQVAFIKTNVSQWEIYGGVGPGAWPPYVLNALDIVNRALIVNPDLERGQ